MTNPPDALKRIREAVASSSQMITVTWSEMHPCFSTRPDQDCWAKMVDWFAEHDIGFLAYDVQSTQSGEISGANFKLWSELRRP